MFCRETVKDLRRTHERHPDYPRPLFFHMGTPGEGAAFFEQFWPAAASVADKEMRFYRGFSIARASLLRLLGPRSWLPALRALLKGNGVGRPQADVFMMPGVFLVQGGVILSRHPFRGPGDHPDWETFAGHRGSPSAPEKGPAHGTS
ncbi:MAG TPA: AhpC/TSA family protein [Planctomycetota bacterium]|jgi:hypothetical protein|nr:AhpC/TSA family protein [Planctomycetota bacterium]